MIGRMCDAHTEPEECAEHLDNLDGKGVFPAMLKAGVFTEDFRRGVLEDVVEGAEMPDEEKTEMLEHLDEMKNASSDEGYKKGDSLKPLSVKDAVKNSYKILRGRVPDG
tara:strand:+ start:4787 stop:5113 length:327 start_codon:yes stop_codon:yes gene_type:complete